MTAPPQIITRALTFNFAQAVSVTTGLPDIMEVAIIPLEDGSVGGQATYAGGLKMQTVELTDPVNSVTFNLIPSYSPGLTSPINYRVMWRAGITGRTETYDFAMPDEDLTWDDLSSDISNLITGTAYLQQSDLGVPGRVCRLDQNGFPTNSAGTPMASSDDVSAVSAALNIEIINREQADLTNRIAVESELEVQTAATLTSAQSYTDNKIATVNTTISGETTAREAQDTALSGQITTAQNALQTQITTNATNITTLQNNMSTKADLDGGGHIPMSEIPEELITNAFPVASQAAMLALTNPPVHRGDLAVRPDGIFLLIADDPSQLANWVNLSVVTSVNGYRGAVVLAAADVGAIPVGGTISQSQVTGLATTLLGKTDTTTTAALQAQVTGIINDTTLVHTYHGTIADAVLPPDIALINPSGQVTTKGGLVVASGAGGSGVVEVNGYTTPIVNLSLTDVASQGGSIAETQVTGLSTDLANRPLTTDPRLSNARTPTPHASTHAALGSDPVTLDPSQITGLAPMLSNNALTSTSNAVNRISSLEGRVTTLESGGGGGGGGGTATTGVFYDSANITTDVTDFTQVFLHSPFGLDSDGTITGTTNTPYYLHTGVRPADVAFPVITQNGHLQLRKWNESNPADPVYALQSSLANYALESDFTNLSTTVTNLSATAATQTQITTLAGTGGVVAKANQSDLATAQNNITSLQNSLSATNTTLQGQINTLAGVGGLVSKANAADLTAASANITTLQNQMPTKADLTSGKLPLNETPQNIPISYISGLTPYLANLNSSTGTFDASKLTNIGNIPQILMGSVANLIPSLTAKADLDGGGHVPLAEIPASAITNVVQVANQAAMLALSPTVAHAGTICVITATANAGTYVLSTADPSQLGNWVQLPGGTGSGTITSVNGYTGPTVVLSYTDVGALAANAAIPISQITGLQPQLNTFATTTAMNTALSGKTAFSDVQNMLYTSSFVKRADYVATTAIASLAGLQSVDGTLPPAGAIVLVTNQSSSVNNGLWVVTSSGSWTRPPDYATGSYLAKDTIVIVSNQSTGANGTTNNATIWQNTATSGFIDTNAATWSRIGYVANPFVPIQGNGMSISGSTFAVNAQTGGGLVSTSSGIATDPNLTPRKFIGTVPSGNTLASITHNLNTFTPQVSIWDTGSNTLVLAGVQATTANTIQIEFGSSPASGQYRVMVTG